MKIDMTGQTFGNWTVVKKDEDRHNKRNSYWICRCRCGTVRSLTRSSLITGRSQSCGCVAPNLKGINSTHGLSDTRIYKEWLSMRKRCKSKSDKSAKSYYFKNITVCDEWNRDFMSFYKWSMENGYSDDLTIDRIDNSKGYFPENCRWITNDAQQRNKTNNIHVLYNGEDWCLRPLCIELGFPYKLAHRRYKRAKNKGIELSAEELFAPIHTEKIPYRYRKTK